MSSSHFFLGANSCSGFVSLYDNFSFPQNGDFLFVIKGSPGCGKSTLMRAVGAAAEDLGQDVEYILCSGDPDSLDGVWLLDRHLGFVDGTAPHVIEAQFPGACSRYLDLSQFLDCNALQNKRADIILCNQQYQELYQAAYRQLALCADRISFPSGFRNDAADDAQNTAQNLLPPRDSSVCLHHRFLSAISCKGLLTLRNTLDAYPYLTALLQPADYRRDFLRTLADSALERGYNVILCHDPLLPDLPQALLLPDTGHAFFAEPLHPTGLDTAVNLLASAKSLHDQLEAMYRPCVDFDQCSAFTETIIRQIFS